MRLDDEKRALRRSLSLGRRERDPGASRRAGERAAELILAAPEFAVASRVALYAACADELPTRAVFEGARGARKQLLFPRCLAGGNLAFVRVDRWEDLCPGRYGVLEPAGEGGEEPLGPGDLVLVPGQAFDSAGNRLGRGKGYYDRTFSADRPDSPTLFGCAFEERVLESVPAGRLDRRVDAVVTDERFRRVGERDAG
ncbi:MAG: 5-formyltetrahydrofolate cyclo-ligase [Deltaproteobacteria bacterium]|nr:5-formyltetrahydrofolate cyclo-ligase [Deltaproteobacteria bacterium]